MMKTTGTREEVWKGAARKTGGGLVKADLMMNPRGTIVSIKQSTAAKARYPALIKKLCDTPIAVAQRTQRAAPTAPPAPAPVAAAPFDLNNAMRERITAKLGFGPPQNLTKKQKGLYSAVFQGVNSVVRDAIKEGATPREALNEYADIDGVIEVARDDPRWH